MARHYAETGEETPLFQVRNDAGQAEGDPMYLTWSQHEDLDAQLPDGWYIEERIRP